MNVNDKSDDHEQEPEQMSTEENNSSESFKVTSRLRSGSTSSSTSLTSSDDEISPELPIKGEYLQILLFFCIFMFLFQYQHLILNLQSWNVKEKFQV